MHTWSGFAPSSACMRGSPPLSRRNCRRHTQILILSITNKQKHVKDRIRYNLDRRQEESIIILHSNWTRQQLVIRSISKRNYRKFQPDPLCKHPCLLTCTVSWWPANAARYKGVRPKLPLEFGSAPYCRSSCMQSVLPPAAASDTGVFLLASSQSASFLCRAWMKARSCSPERFPFALACASSLATASTCTKKHTQSTRLITASNKQGSHEITGRWKTAFNACFGHDHSMALPTTYCTAPAATVVWFVVNGREQVHGG